MSNLVETGCTDHEHERRSAMIMAALPYYLWRLAQCRADSTMDTRLLLRRDRAAFVPALSHAPHRRANCKVRLSSGQGRACIAPSRAPARCATSAAAQGRFRQNRFEESADADAVRSIQQFVFTDPEANAPGKGVARYPVLSNAIAARVVSNSSPWRTNRLLIFARAAR
jgi:hypothetical protein